MNKILGMILIIGMLGMTFALTGCTTDPNAPDVAGSAGWVVHTPLSVAGDNTMQIPTNISCTTTQNCIDYALQQDPTAKNIQATCDKTCTFITEKTPTVGN